MSLTQLQQIIRSTLWHYISAVVLVGFISTLSFWATQDAIDEQQADGYLINIAGRQRMLSQRIALYSHKQIDFATQPELFQRNTKALLSSAKLMRDSHQALIDATQTPSIKVLYFGGAKPSLNEQVIRFTEEARYLANLSPEQFPIPETLSVLSTQHSDTLLKRLNEVVSAYENYSTSKIMGMKELTFILWLVMMLSLGLISYYILRPSLNLIRTSLMQEKQKQNRMQLAADSADLGIWEYQLDSGRLIWDHSMSRIFNDGNPTKPDEAFEIFKERLHPQDQEYVLKKFTNAIDSQTPFHIQYRIVGTNQHIKTIKAHGIIEYDADGIPIAVVGTNQDISETQNREQELINARLAAEHAAQVKGEFLASMSHEIRTPMNGIMGMLELLNRSNLDKSQSQRVSVALSSAKSLLVLINDILDFSKIEAQHLDLECIDFNLRRLLGELSESLSQPAESKGIELILDTINVHDDMVNGDPGRIRQIMTNLISNAIKFTHHGEVLIKVSLEELNIDQWRMHFSIKDSGIGIAKEKQAKLFEAFSQADSSTTREYGGTGLGLAIVKRLCTAMDGHIDITSQVNQGSEFFGEVTLHKSKRAALVAPRYDISKLSILIVDDNAVNREVFSQQLQLWGAQVVQADSAAAALEICSKYYHQHQAIFDIAILDMQMPHTSGVELGQQIKQNSCFASMHLVLMTSMMLDSDHGTLAKMGFCGYFAKPVTTDDMFMALSVIGDGGEAFKQATPLLTHDYLGSLETEQTKSDSEVRSTLVNGENNIVLLVEDNAINQLVATDILEDIGLSVVIADNGQEAIQLLQERTDNMFSLIFMDCQMPIMDGFQACRLIRDGQAGSHYQDIPIIALTANAMKQDRDQCLESGMNDFISKPMDIETLKTVISKWLLSPPNSPDE